MMPSAKGCGKEHNGHKCGKSKGHEGWHQCWCDHMWEPSIAEYPIDPDFFTFAPTAKQAIAEFDKYVADKKRRPRRRRVVIEDETPECLVRIVI